MTGAVLHTIVGLVPRRSQPGESEFPALDLRGLLRSKRLSRSLAMDVVSAGFVISLFVLVSALTWRSWTVSAFPLDAGREMMVPRLLCEGRTLYRDIRCFYGPIGYWLNAGSMAVFGRSENVLWWTNFFRFTVTLGMLYLLARRVLGPMFAALALGAFSYVYFYSLLVPYSASVGYGCLFLVVAAWAYARSLRTAPASPERRQAIADPAARNDSAAQRRVLGWSVCSAVFLSLAATAKHEYAATVSLLAVVLLFDAWVSSGRKQFIRVALGLTVPFGLVAATVLSQTSWSTLIHENLWLPELLVFFGGARLYGPGGALTEWSAIHLVEWSGLLAIAAGGLLLVTRAVSRAALWVTVAGLVAVIGSEIYRSYTGAVSSLPLAFPKPRALELIETSPLLVLPLAIVAAIFGLLRVRCDGLASTWRNLEAGTRIGIFCTIGCLSLLSRQVPMAVGIAREPFAAVAFVWLLTTVLPGICRFAKRTATAWRIGIAGLLLVGTAAAGNNITYYQNRSGLMLAGTHDSAAFLSRRKPFTPAYFSEAVNLVQKHCEVGQHTSIACVPEGAWIHVLLGLDWPTRDTQWMPFCQQWILDDLATQPPRFLLVMNEFSIRTLLPRVHDLVRHGYLPIETTASGMTLYERAPSMASASTFDSSSINTDLGKQESKR